MDVSTFIHIIQESLFMILTAVGLLIFSMIRGKQALINLIFALYGALLLYKTFPYFDALTNGGEGDGIIMVGLFAVLTVLLTLLFGRHMITDGQEPIFNQIGHKVILALLGTILIMIYSFNVLPVTDIITPGSPIQTLFASEDNFFFWLVTPLIILFFL